MPKKNVVAIEGSTLKIGKEEFQITGLGRDKNDGIIAYPALDSDGKKVVVEIRVHADFGFME